MNKKMAKRSIYRVIGVISAKNRDIVLKTITPYLIDYKRVTISPLKQDFDKKSPKQLRLQVDFYKQLDAEKCRQVIFPFFLEDKSKI